MALVKFREITRAAYNNLINKEANTQYYITETDGTFSIAFGDRELKGNQPLITGAASTITSNNLTTNRALISNGNGKVAVSAVTSTQLGYLSGVTSSIQTQLNSKIAKDSSVNGLNMNNVTETGFYYGYTMTNAAVTAISTFMVINYSPDWIIQKQFIPASGGNREFIRSRHSGTTWSAWTEIASQPWVTTNTRSNTWTPTWVEVSGKPTFAPSNAQKNSDITKAEIEAKLTGPITTHTHSNAATNAAGFMSAADKTKLDGLVTNATHTGDVTGSVALTIANDKVTNAKLADMPTARIKGRVSSNTGDPEDLTQAQVRMFLGLGSSAYVATSSFRSNTWTPKIGDLPTGASGTTVALGNHTHIASEVGARSDTWTPNWNEVTSKPSWIGNSKPTYTASDVGARSDTWLPTWGQISGRPSLATVATSGNYNDLSNKPNIPGATTPLFNTYISAYDYDIRTTTILNQGRARFIVVISTSANNSGFKFNGNRISGPNLNNIENWISYNTGFFIYEIVTMPNKSFFAIKASGQSQYSMYSSFRVDFSSPAGESDYIDMVAWEV